MLIWFWPTQISCHDGYAVSDSFIFTLISGNFFIEACHELKQNLIYNDNYVRKL